MVLKLNKLLNVICHSEIFHTEKKAFKNSLLDQGILPSGNYIDRIFRTYNEGKLFKFRNKHPEEFLQLLFSQEADAVGFKIFNNQNNGILNNLIRDQKVKKIILVRKNLLRSYVSRRVSIETGVWNKYSGDNISLKNVQIDYDDFLSYCNKTSSFIRFVTDQLESTNQTWLNLTYKQITSSFPYAKIASFLDIDMQTNETEVNIIRQNPFTLADIISNYNEIFQKLHHDNLGSYLEE